MIESWKEKNVLLMLIYNRSTNFNDGFDRKYCLFTAAVAFEKFYLKDNWYKGRFEMIV
jgi:hypothetical protein